ncbi:MAG TPA: universal stress protein [Hyphomicrobium sp.]|jgi:nucleotide-binding universal stress UspA family protein|nr:universal stress protein [Hyphomicrobium sp.]
MTKILCAIDDTDHSKSAIELAGNMAKAFDAELTILVVNQLVGGYGRGGGPTLLWTESEVQGTLAGAAAGAKKAGAAKIRTLGADSRDVARAITIFAEDNDFDQIVVGTGGKGAVSRMMLGSVSRDVVDRAHCPVTVAR